MKKLPLILLLLLMAIFCRGQGVANVQYTFTDFTAVPQMYQLCSMTPLWKVGVNGQTVVGAPTVTLPTGTNGSVVFSNVWMGASYLVQLRGYSSQIPITAFTNSFPASLGGSTNTINGANWVFYSFITQGGVMWTNIAQSNLVSFLQVTMAVSNGVVQAETFSMTNGNTNQYIGGYGVTLITNGGTVTISAIPPPSSATNIYIGSGNQSTLTVTTNSSGSFTLLVPLQTSLTNGLLQQAQLFSITNGQSAVWTNLNNSLLSVSNFLQSGITNALNATTNQSFIAQSNAQVVATNLYNAAIALLTLSTNGVLGQVASWLGTTNSLVKTNVLSQYVSTNTFTAGTNTIAQNAQFNLAQTTTVLQAEITTVLNTNASQLLSTAAWVTANFQPKSGILSNLAQTGAMTNGIVAGLNTTLTTNGTGQTVVSATNQTFLIAGLAPTNLLAQYMPTNAVTNFYPMVGNPSNFLTAGALAFTNNVRLQNAITNTQPNAQIGSSAFSATSFTVTNAGIYNPQGQLVFSTPQNGAQAGWLVLQTNIYSTGFLWWMFNPLTWTSDGLTTNFQIQGGGIFAPWIFANQLRGPATNQFDYDGAAMALSNAWNFGSGNAAGVNTNRFDTNGAAAAAYTNAYTAATNAAGLAISNAFSNFETNYIPSTNGRAFHLTIPDTLILNGKTNFVASTNAIAIVGGTLADGTYQGAAFLPYWTNTYNSAFTILFSYPGFFMQSNGITEYSFGLALGAGTAVNAPATPIPYASFCGYQDLNGIIWRGYISSTNLTALLKNAVGVPVVAGYGLTNQIASGTNMIWLNTNTVIALIAANSIGPTNGIGTNAFFILLNNWATTNLIAVTNITAASSSTNLLGTTPNGNEVAVPWASLPAGGGGSTANAFITNTPNAFPSVTAPNANFAGSNLTANGYVSSTVLGYGGTPFIQFEPVTGNSQHFVIGSTNNGGPGNDSGSKDLGIGIVGGNYNSLPLDYPNNHMVSEYIWGGVANTNSTFQDTGAGLAWFTNNNIFASEYSTIWTYDSGVVNDDLILNSTYSGISNNGTAANFNHNFILNGTGTYILNGSNSAVIGANITITNNNVTAISDGSTPLISTTNNQLILRFLNGVMLNGSPLLSGIGFSNGIGYGTTLSSASVVTSTNLVSLSTSYLNGSNLLATWTPPNANFQTGQYAWGLVPNMTFSNAPSGYAYANGTLSDVRASTNAWALFSTNTAGTTIGFNPGVSNILGYTFGSPVTVSGASIQWGDFDQALYQYLFQYCPSGDGVTWVTLAKQNGTDVWPAWNGATNYFTPVTAQMFRFAFTNAAVTFELVAPAGIVPTAQLYGPVPLPSPINSGNNAIVSQSSSLSLIASNGINAYGPVNANGPVNAATMSAQGASFNVLSIGSGLTINGMPVNLSTLTNQTPILLWATNFPVGTVATNYNGLYAFNSVSNYFTNFVSGWELVPPSNTNNALYWQGGQQPLTTWYAVTNLGTFAANYWISQNPNLPFYTNGPSGMYPFYTASTSIGYWNPGSWWWTTNYLSGGGSGPTNYLLDQTIAAGFSSPANTNGSLPFTISYSNAVIANSFGGAAWVNTVNGNDSKAVIGSQFSPFLTVSNAVYALDAAGGGDLYLTPGQTFTISNELFLTNIVFRAKGAVLTSCQGFSSTFMFYSIGADGFDGGLYICSPQALPSTPMINDDTGAGVGVGGGRSLFFRDCVFSNAVGNGAVINLGSLGTTNTVDAYDSKFYAQGGTFTSGDPFLTLTAVGCRFTVFGTNQFKNVIEHFSGFYDYYGCVFVGYCTNAGGGIIGMNFSGNVGSTLASLTHYNFSACQLDLWITNTAGGTNPPVAIPFTYGLSQTNAQFFRMGFGYSLNGTNMDYLIPNREGTVTLQTQVQIMGVPDDNGTWNGFYNLLSTNAANGCAIFTNYGTSHILVFQDPGVNIGGQSWCLEHGTTNDHSPIAFTSETGNKPLPTVIDNYSGSFGTIPFHVVYCLHSVTNTLFTWNFQQ